MGEAVFRVPAPCGLAISGVDFKETRESAYHLRI